VARVPKGKGKMAEDEAKEKGKKRTMKSLIEIDRVWSSS
jgi:hypothetical protein